MPDRARRADYDSLAVGGPVVIPITVLSRSEPAPESRGPIPTKSADDGSGRRRSVSDPVADQRIGNCENDRTDEYADETESDQSADHARED